MTDKEVIEDALTKHPDCEFGKVVNGMSCVFRLTRVVRLWRNEECWSLGDPHKYEVEGYPA